MVFWLSAPSLPPPAVTQDIVFIGPSPEVIARIGDKSAARQLAFAAGVPVVLGYDDSEQSDERLVTAARGIGFPLMVKAAAGGGGKGMRIVAREQRLPEAIAAARREAQSAFGDDVCCWSANRRAAPRRVSDLRRRARPRRAFGRARVLDPAPASEGDRGDALAGALRRSCARAWATAAIAVGARARLHQRRHGRVHPRRRDGSSTSSR